MSATTRDLSTTTRTEKGKNRAATAIERARSPTSWQSADGTLPLSNWHAQRCPDAAGPADVRSGRGLAAL